MPKELLRELNDWMTTQPDKPVYPEAIRRLIAAGLRFYATSAPGNLRAPERIHAEGTIKPGWPLGELQATEAPIPRDDDRDDPARP